MRTVTKAETPKLICHPLTHQDDQPKKIKTTRKNVCDINGVSYKKYFDFQQAGIKTLKQFVKAGIPSIAQVMGRRENGCRQIYLRGLSLYQNRIIKINDPIKLTDQPVYVDIETDSCQSIVWMIGIYISKANEFIQLVANTPKGEQGILKECIEILSEHHNEHVITYSGTHFDERVLRSRFNKARLKHNHLNFEDILLDIKKSLALPLKSYSLGDVASFYGYNFRHPFMDGRQVAMLYEQHARNLSKFKGLKKLREYNEDDVMSMVGIVSSIYL